VSVRRISAPAETNEVWTEERTDSSGAEVRRCDDQSGVLGVKVMLCGGSERVVPRPPSRTVILGSGSDGVDIVFG